MASLGWGITMSFTWGSWLVIILDALAVISVIVSVILLVCCALIDNYLVSLSKFNQLHKDLTDRIALLENVIADNSEDLTHKIGPHKTWEGLIVWIKELDIERLKHSAASNLIIVKEELQTLKEPPVPKIYVACSQIDFLKL